jgi:hypothetical protein
MRIPCGILLWALLAGCGECPDRMAGNSAGCGNPPKLAALEPTQVNCMCNSNGGDFFPTVFSISFSDSLKIQMSGINTVKPDSIRGQAFVYPPDYVPFFQAPPLDSFPVQGSVIVLHSGEVQNALRSSPGSISGILPFSLLVRLRFYLGLVYKQEGNFAGLGFDSASGKFIYSYLNPLGDSGRGHYFYNRDGYYEGNIQPSDSLFAGARVAHVYIPGSPHHAEVNLRDGHFKMDSLPVFSEFELRLLVIPESLPANHKVPTYLLTSDTSSSPDRPFTIKARRDSVSLPDSLY